MPQFLQIDGLRISEGSLRVAVERYEEFKASEDYNEAYKWETLDEAHTWLEENELRTDTVEEFVDLIQDLQPQSGPLVDWRQIQRLRDFVEEDRTRSAAALEDLLYGEGERPCLVRGWGRTPLASSVSGKTRVRGRGCRVGG